MVKIYFCCLQDWSDVKNVTTRLGCGHFEAPQRSEASGKEPKNVLFYRNKRTRIYSSST